MNRELVEFDYVDAKGKHSHRIVYPLYKPTDNLFSIDLSEFALEEREFLTEALNDIHRVYLEEIKQLGLGANYRYFKKDNIENEKGISIKC